MREWERPGAGGRRGKGRWERTGRHADPDAVSRVRVEVQLGPPLSRKKLKNAHTTLTTAVSATVSASKRLQPRCEALTSPTQPSEPLRQPRQAQAQKQVEESRYRAPPAWPRWPSATAAPAQRERWGPPFRATRTSWACRRAPAERIPSHSLVGTFGEQHNKHKHNTVQAQHNEQRNAAHVQLGGVQVRGLLCPVGAQEAVPAGAVRQPVCGRTRGYTDTRMHGHQEGSLSRGEN